MSNVETQRVNPVWLEIDRRQAEALRSAADYLSGFGRISELLDDARFPISDLRDVVSTLRELYERTDETGRAA